MLWMILFSLLCLLFFLLLQKKRRMSIAPAFFFLLFLSSAGLFGISYLHILSTTSNSILLLFLFYLLLAPLVLLFLFGMYALISILLINAYIMWKRERRSLSHTLGFLLALSFIGFLLLPRILTNFNLPYYIDIFIYAGYFLLSFYFAHILLYGFASVLALFPRPPYQQNFIIICGCGLLNGKPSPLLKKRIEKAVAFYKAQKNLSFAPKIICSGGKGVDEPHSEAFAMAEYARTLGVSPEDLLLEDKSKTTLQNLQFSKDMMDNIMGTTVYRAIFSTSNYHVLRTGMYARSLGLNMSGLGAKTALYYLPNAFIREYIAYVVMFKKYHMAFVFLTFLLSFIASMVLFFHGGGY